MSVYPAPVRLTIFVYRGAAGMLLKKQNPEVGRQESAGAERSSEFGVGAGFKPARSLKYNDSRFMI